MLCVSVCVCVYTTDVQYHLFLACVTWTYVPLGKTPESLVLKAVAICDTFFTISACIPLECCDCVDTGVVNIKKCCYRLTESAERDFVLVTCQAQPLDTPAWVSEEL